MPKSLSIIIPAYNEEKNIENAVLHNLETISSLGFDFEIIIVNDGSSDSTAVKAKALISRSPAIRFIDHPRNLGLGAAISTGIKSVTKEYVIFSPCDSPFDREDLESFATEMGKADLIIGYREARPGYTRFMLLSSRVYNLLIRLLFGIKVKDINWIHMYRTKIFEKIKIEASGVFMIAEVVVKAKRLDYSIAEVPCKMKLRVHGRASASKISVILKTIRELIKFLFI